MSLRPAIPTPEQREAQKEANRAVLLRTRGREGVTLGGEVRAGQAKTTAFRDAALLEMARDRRCLLGVPLVCYGAVTETTVACHSNLSIHGKGKSRKADDCYSVWGCRGCHSWLDVGTAKADLKRMTFALAHIDQVQAWRVIAADPSEPERFRKAARRALDHLNATPIGADDAKT